MGDDDRHTDRPADAGRAAPFAGESERPAILVADHDATVRSLLHAALYRSGFNVHLAADGAEALQLYQRERDAIRMVLLDLHLEGRDGLEVLAELKQLDPRVRCCFTASYLGRLPLPRLLASGAMRVFMKPFPLGEVSRELWHMAGAAVPCPA